MDSSKRIVFEFAPRDVAAATWKARSRNVQAWDG